MLMFEEAVQASGLLVAQASHTMQACVHKDIERVFVRTSYWCGNAFLCVFMIFSERSSCFHTSLRLAEANEHIRGEV